MKPLEIRFEPLRFAIVGCGRIAQQHAAAIDACSDLATLRALVDSDSSRARGLAQRYRARVAADLNAVLQDPSIDAIVLCTPNDFHAEQAVRALAAGKHVLVEKPMAESVADAEAMAEAAHNNARVLAIGQTLRHTAPVRWLQDHLNDFGRLRAVEVSMCVHWAGPQATWWKDRPREAGLIMSLFAPHALDFVQLAFGNEDPLSVHAETARFQNDWAGEDEAMILLRYPRGRLAQVHISYNQKFIVDRKTVHFDDAMIRIEDSEFAWVDDKSVVAPSTAIGDFKRMGGRDFGHWFQTQLREFVAATRGATNRSVLHDDGVRLTKLLRRAIESSLRNDSAD